MPAVAVTPSLERLVVQFVYSAGAIHAIHSEPVYRDDNNHKQQQQQIKDDLLSFTVQYMWMEEPHVTPEAGQMVLFLAVVCASVWMVYTILMTETPDSSANRERSSYNAVPKYE